MTEIINGRYILHNKIGSGGMGVVYRTIDRLTGDTVALKRIRLSSNLHIGDSLSPHATEDDLRLALAHEFQILAGLRHPHIISVLDYGFDEERQPFFTMTYVPESQNILESAQDASIERKIELVQQLLQALAYLHRRGVLHRDLKPDNVLVNDGSVRVLDFGLSASDQTSGSDLVGTPLYMAPELFDGSEYSEAADLYTVGVLLYQLLIGHHPFAPLDHTFLDRVLDADPDLAQVDERLRPFLSTLLAKEHTDRFSSAKDALTSLAEALGQQLPQESAAIRESYLQAAKFVGREAELAQLTKAIHQAATGKGSAWLLGGESGVGKSRLLKELRTQALVNGFFVLQGQVVEEGSGLPFQLWRDPLRHLLVAVEAIDELTASVLLPLVPDIGQLLNRDVKPAPELSGDATQQRLLTTITRLFLHAQTPIFLILEDLHWASESLLAISSLIHLIDQHQLMIVGSYRHDERPELSEILGGTEQMLLPRLNASEIASLSEAMLGAMGREDSIVELIQRETEGNTFFAVEVVRALAEEAGRLDYIGQMALPDMLLPNGIRDIVQRRVEQLPESARTLLTKVAVAGRELELPLVQLLATDLSDKDVVNWWLPLCADRAILDVNNGLWQFSHGKIRDGLLAELSVAEMRKQHAEVATAIERLYPDGETQAVRLVHHWHEAQNLTKECHYAKIAGEQAAKQYANDEAITFLTRSLELTPEDAIEEIFNLLSLREEVLMVTGNQHARFADIERMAELLERLGNSYRVGVLNKQGQYAYDVSQYEEARKYAEKAIALADNSREQKQLINAYVVLGRSFFRLGLYDESRDSFEKVLPIAIEQGALAEQSLILTGLASAHLFKDKIRKAKELYEQSLVISQQIGDRSLSIVAAYINSGRVLAFQGYFADAQSNYRKALAIARESGNKHLESVSLHNMGACALMANELDDAEHFLQDALSLSRSGEFRMPESSSLIYLGRLAWKQGKLDEARTRLDEGRLVSEKIKLPQLSVVADAIMTSIVIAEHDRSMVEKLCEAFIIYLNEDTRCEKVHERFLVLYLFASAFHWLQHPRQWEIVKLAYTVFNESFGETDNSETTRAMAQVEEYVGIQRLFKKQPPISNSVIDS